MTEQQFLEQLTGERWTGVKFLETGSSSTRPFARVCEAVHYSFNGDLTLARGAMECPGALHSLRLVR